MSHTLPRHLGDSASRRVGHEERACEGPLLKLPSVEAIAGAGDEELIEFDTSKGHARDIWGGYRK